MWTTQCKPLGNLTMNNAGSPFHCAIEPSMLGDPVAIIRSPLVVGDDERAVQLVVN